MPVDEVQNSFSLSLDQIPQLVGERNPSLRQKSYQSDRSEALEKSAGLMENPSLSTSYFLNPKSQEMTLGLQIKQSIPRNGKLRHEKRTADLASDLMLHEYELYKREVIRRTTKAAISWLASNSLLEIYQDRMSALRQSLDFHRNLEKKGEASGFEIQRLEIELANHNVFILSGELARLTHEQVLRQELDIPQTETITFQHPTLPSPDGELWTVQAESQPIPEVEQMQTSIEKLSTEMELEKSRRLEDMELGLGIQQARIEDQPIGLENETAVGIVFTIPIPVRDRSAGRVQEKLLAIEQHRSALLQLNKNIERKGQSLVAQMHAQMKTLHHIENTLLPATRKLISDLEIAYTQGIATFDAIMTAQKEMNSVKILYIEKLETFHHLRTEYIYLSAE